LAEAAQLEMIGLACVISFTVYSIAPDLYCVSLSTDKNNNRIAQKSLAAQIVNFDSLHCDFTAENLRLIFLQ